MSRVREGDGEDYVYDEHGNEISAEDDFQDRVEAACREPGVRGKFEALRAHLDAMPVKAVVSDRFVDLETGAMCSVALLCASQGATAEELAETERRSREEREESYDGCEEGGGWDGPTVAKATEFGIPDVVAYDLEYLNDQIWTDVVDRVVHHPTEFTDRVFPHEVRVRNEDSGYLEVLYGPYRVVRRQAWDETVTRPMTDAERFHKLYGHVAGILARS